MVHGRGLLTLFLLFSLSAHILSIGNRFVGGLFLLSFSYFLFAVAPLPSLSPLDAEGEKKVLSMGEKRDTHAYSPFSFFFLL